MILWKKSRKWPNKDFQMIMEMMPTLMESFLTHLSLSYSHHNDVIYREPVYFFHITAFSSQWVLESLLILFKYPLQKVYSRYSYGIKY